MGLLCTPVKFSVNLELLLNCLLGGKTYFLKSYLRVKKRPTTYIDMNARVSNRSFVKTSGPTRGLRQGREHCTPKAPSLGHSPRQFSPLWALPRLSEPPQYLAPLSLERCHLSIPRPKFRSLSIFFAAQRAAPPHCPVGRRRPRTLVPLVTWGPPPRARGAALLTRAPSSGLSAKPRPVMQRHITSTETRT